MNNRMMAALAVAALLCMCAAPMLSEDSDGADSSRVSTMYIYHASFTLDAGERYRYGWGDLML